MGRKERIPAGSPYTGYHIVHSSVSKLLGRLQGQVVRRCRRRNIASFTVSGRSPRPTPALLETLEPRLLLSAVDPLSGGSGGGLDATRSIDEMAITKHGHAHPSPGHSALQSALASGAVKEVLWQDARTHAYTGEWVLQLSGLPAIAGESQVVHAQALLDELTAVGSVSPEIIDPEVTEYLNADGLFKLQTSEQTTYEALHSVLGQLDQYRYVEPNFALIDAVTPDDPRYSELYGLHNTGQTGGTADADIDGPEAWDITVGDGSVVVGVIDTGVDYNHPDLVDNMWRNPGETPGDGIDNDNNGFVDDVYGWDFVNNDNDPMDDNSHGTHVAGTIAASGDNGTGVVGVSWDTQIMALKFLSGGGSGSTAGAIAAINYATMMARDYGVNVRMTSNSWGGGGFSSGLHDAITAAGAANMLFVAAAGNEGSNNDSSPHYPSGYDLDNIISVAATDHDDNKAGFSNYGATTVDLGAPGVNTLSALPGGGYGTKSGTSMATPHVAGVAALAWSLNPGATYTEIRDAILGGVDPVSSMNGRTVTGGRLNAFNTLQRIGLVVSNSVPADGEVVHATLTDFTFTFADAYDPATVQAGDLRVNGNPADTVALDDATTVTFSFASSPIGAEGVQTMELPDGSVARLSDGLTNAGWTAEFRYDATPLTVVTTNPVANATVTAPLTSISVEFNEPLDPGSVDVDDLLLSRGAVTGVNVLNPTTLEFQLEGIIDEQPLTATIPALSVTDLVGNPLTSDFAADFFVDIGAVPYPGPLEAKAPAGGLVYDPSVGGAISLPGDTDSFTVALDAGQTITAVATVDASLRIVLEALDPASSSIGSVTAAKAGDGAVLQTLTAATAGTYTLAVRSADGTTGQYDLRLYLNAAAEEEEAGGPANDTAGSAEHIDAGFIALPGGAFQRGAVVGRAEAGGADWYAMTLDADEPTSLVLAPWAGTGVGLNLYDPSGTLIAGISATDGPALLRDFAPEVSGTYKVEVEAAPGSADRQYTLLVTRGLSFEAEANDDVDEANDLTLAGAVLGAISGPSVPVIASETEPNDDGSSGGSAADLPFANDWSGSFVESGADEYSATLTGEIASGSDGDWDFFRILAAPGETFEVEMRGSPSGQGTLGDPYLRLYDRDGNQIASNDDTFGLESFISYASFAYPGEYYVVADSFGSSTGSYTLHATHTTADPLFSAGGDDYFAINVNAGDALAITSATPFDGPLAIENLLDPRIELYDPAGNLVASDDNGASDGRNAALSHVAGVSGTFTVLIEAATDRQGEYVLDIDGATGSPDATIVEAIDPADGQRMMTAPTTATIDLSRAVRVASLDAGDLTVDGAPATGFALIDADTLEFTLPTGLSEGAHNIQVDGLSDLAGQAIAPFASTFHVDTTAPRIIDSSVQSGDVLNPGSLTLTFRFDEPLDADAIDTSDVELAGTVVGAVSPDAVSYDTGTSTLTVEFNDLGEGGYTLTLLSGDGQFEDVLGNDLDGEPVFPIPPNVSGDGNPGGNFVVDFDIDIDVAAFPAPLVPLAPLGSLVYEAMADAAIGAAGDVDALTIDLEAGLALTIISDPNSALRPMVELLGPGGSVLAGASAAAVGEPAVIDGFATPVAGTYTLRFTGAASTIGAYEATLRAGADLEAEAFGGPANDLPATAQNLDGAFASPVAGGERAGVVGIADGSTLDRTERVEGGLFSPNIIDVAFDNLAAVPIGDGTLTITARADLGDSSEHLAFDAEGQLAQNIFVHDGGEDVEASTTVNLPLAALTDLLADGRIDLSFAPSSDVDNFGGSYLEVTLSYPLAGSSDHFSFTATANQPITLAVAAGAGGRATIELLDPSGNPVASGVDADNADRVIDGYVPATGGTYVARVIGDGRYNLLVTRDLAFESEPNDEADEADRLTHTGRALGSLGGNTTLGQRLFGFDDNGQLIVEIDPDTGTTLNSFPSPVGSTGGPDFGVATTSSSVLVGGTASSEIYELDPDTGATLRIFPNPGIDISGMAFLNDEIFVLTDSPSGSVTVIDYQSGQVARTFTTDSAISESLTGTGQTLIAGDRGNQLYRVDPLTGAATPLGALTSTGTNEGLGVVGDRVFVGDDSTVDVYDMNTLTYLQSIGSFTELEGLGGDGGAVDAVDEYRLDVNAGDALTLRTLTPGGAVGQPTNALDPGIELYDPAGNLVASDDNSAPDGRNALLNHTAAATGEYHVRVLSPSAGDYVLVAEGYTGAPQFRVAGSDLPDGEVYQTPPTRVTLDFSSPFQVGSVQASDLTVNGAAATAVQVVDGDTLRFDLPGLLKGDYQLTIADGAMVDLAGQALAGYASGFHVELEAIPPAGSMIYDPAVAGEIGGAGEVDPFVFSADHPQQITAILTADAALIGSIELVAPSGSVIASATAPAAGAPILVQSADTTTGGNYQLRVTGAGGTTGGYTLSMLLNAAQEAEALAPLARNDTIADAQSLDGAFVDLGDGARRAAAVGLGDASTLQVSRTHTGAITHPDVVTLSFDASNWPAPFADATVTVTALADLQSSSETFEVDVEGMVTETLFEAGGADGSQVSTTFTLPMSELPAILADGVIDMTFTPTPEVNLSFSDGFLTAAIDYPTAPSADHYSFTVETGEAFSVLAEPVGDGAVFVEVLNPDGTLFAAGEPDGQLASVVADAIPWTVGTHTVRVTGEGEYALMVTGGLSFGADRPDDEPTQSIDLTGAVLGHVGRAADPAAATSSPASPAVQSTLPLPLDLYDGDGFLWDIEGDGNINNGTNDAYDGGMDLNGMPYFSTGAGEDGNREVAIGPASLGNVEVLRKVFVPDDAGFARFLEIVTNNSAVPQTYTVDIYTNLGSDSGTQLIDESSGNGVFGPEDLWLITDDSSDGSGDPTMLHVVGDGEGLTPTTASQPGGSISYAWNLTLAPGETQIVMHFASQNSNRATAAAKAAPLTGLEIEQATEGLSADERQQIVNFRLDDPNDSYRVTVSSGDELSISTRTPGDGPFSFFNNLDAAIELYDPAGNLVASDDNSAPDGRNARLDYVAPTGGEYEVRVLAMNETGGEYVLRVDGATGLMPPTVTSVHLRGSAWSSSFMNGLGAAGIGDAHGVAVPVGEAGEPILLPYLNVDTLRLGFSEQVDVEQEDLRLVGVTEAGTIYYEFSGFSYYPAAHAATWTVQAPIGADRLLLILEDSVVDLDGNRLDGDVVDGAGLPSGDGLPGGQLAARFDVLPGDVDRSGQVNIFDTIRTRNRMFNDVGEPNYDAAHDADGSGSINIFDMIKVRNRQFTELPDDEPVDLFDGLSKMEIEDLLADLLAQ